MSQEQERDSDQLSDEERAVLGAYRNESTDLPSEELDQVLRAAARRAVRAGPRGPGRFRLGAWNMPLAVAATVVLSATVVFMAVREQGLDPLHEPAAPPAVGGAPAAAGAPSAPAPTASSPGPAQPAPVQSMALRSVPPVPQHRPAEASPAPVASPAMQAATADASQVTEDRAEAVRAEQIVVQAQESPRASAGRESKRAAPDGERKRAEQGDMAPLLAAAPEPEASGTGQRVREQASLRSAAPQRLEEAAAVASLEVRVERIRQMLRTGQRARALDFLAALRREHPDYVLPPDLAELAKELPATGR